ncbi:MULTISPECIES: hypothetical protein [Bacillaceae]|uniref:Uncharacterized protein n=1 Tax=Evansella alkalicola TaxID=745819 RepID=A0ABS6JVF6_9BACI|nr:MULTISPECIES: hypothetical protein [Bacillaceae]MBU9722576.1 hypothetical protein [Bacillus alkalicola]
MSKKDMFFISAIIVLLFFSVINFNKISNLENNLNRVNYLHYDVEDVYNAVHSISYEIDTKLEEFLEEQLWIREKSYLVTQVDLDRETIDVLMEWSIRDLQEGEEVSLLYREESEQEWTELPVNTTNGLNFSVEHTFQLTKNYETQVVASSEEMTRGEGLLELMFDAYMNDRVGIHADAYRFDDNTINISIDIFNTLEHEWLQEHNKNDFKIIKANAYLYYEEDTLLWESDLLEDNEDNFLDSYHENIYFHPLVEIEEEFKEEVDKMKLHVVVVDGLGLIYETVTNVIE